MDTFTRHKLLKNPNGEYELILYLDDTLTEFSQELGTKSSIRFDMIRQATLLLYNRYPSIRITVVKVILGGFVISTLPVAADQALANTSSIEQTDSNVFYSVAPGDTLWGLSKRFGTSVDLIKTANNLPSETLTIGQMLVIPKAMHTVQSGDTLYSLSRKYNTTVDSIKEANQMTSTNLSINHKLIIPALLDIPQIPPTTESTSSPNSITHTVVAGDTLYSISKKYSTTVDALKKNNQLTNDVLSLGQRLTIPSTQTVAPIPESTTIPTLPDTYTVVSGDSLYSIALKFGLTVDELRDRNQLVSDVLRIGQVLRIDDNATATPINTLNFKTHIVQSGDSIWSLSIRYGIPQSELLQANGLTTSSMLSIGQSLRIPVHHIPVKETVSPNHGELLNWWTEAQYVFTIGKVAKVTDLATGKTFSIKRTIGANHADCETVTVSDSNTAKAIWGGYSWTPRAVIVEVDGRTLAASMSFYPHEREYIMDNGITGHFDVYFSNSTRHIDGKSDPYHQVQVEKAAGVR